MAPFATHLNLMMFAIAWMGAPWSEVRTALGEVRGTGKLEESDGHLKFKTQAAQASGREAIQPSSLGMSTAARTLALLLNIHADSLGHKRACLDI